MEKLDVDEIRHFSKLQYFEFIFLATLFELADGVADGPPISERIRLRNNEDGILERGGYIRFNLASTSRIITKRGVDEIRSACRKAERHKICRYVYIATTEEGHEYVEVPQTAKALGLEHEAVRQAFKYLMDENLIRRHSVGGFGLALRVVMTSKGIARIEGAEDQFTKGDQIVHNGDIRVNSDNIQTGANSPIQNRSDGSTQVTNITSDDFKQLAELLPQIRSDLPKLGLSEAEAKDVEAQLKTIEAQLEALKPKPWFIAESLKSIFETVSAKAIEHGGDLAFAWFVQLPAITHILSQMPHPKF
jgi:hypothetical protein